MRLKGAIVLSLGLLLSLQLSAQETLCGDGIDNDGDGRIDCFDGDCASDSNCDGFFVIGDEDCSVPITGLTYALDNTSASSNRNIHTQARIALGDVDNDGIPDIIAPHAWDQDIRILWEVPDPMAKMPGRPKHKSPPRRVVTSFARNWK